jgi:hypothetical protein
MPTAADIKKALKEAGLEVYRTRGEVVHLADRVRENLLMDSGTFVRGAAVTPGPQAAPDSDAAPVSVGFVVRAQRNDFPNDGEDRLFERARQLGGPAALRGYVEVVAEVRRVVDPGDGQRTLDTWCEVSFEKAVADLGAAVVEARFALSIEKAVPPTVEVAARPAPR